VKYRPEIDGLRALAVVSVILYHADIGGFTGGYIGVDVFFVISGYLITALIVPQIQRGDFSLRDFYERRARRILPALFAVLVCTMPFAYGLLSNWDLLNYSRSLIAAVLFVSNIFFWQDLHYFAAPGDSKPLLHTWSLGIEEQFYIVFPLLLLLMRRFLPGRQSLVLSALLVVSLLVSVALVLERPSDAFYLIHTRAWELLLGAILAVVVLPEFGRPSMSNAASALGLSLIISSALLYDDSTVFPGMAAIAPCLGAFLFIWSNAHGRNLLGTLLSTKLFVGVGLVSYSLYLWHWPVLVFAQYYSGRSLQTTEKVASLLLCGLLSFVTWKLVEQPFRKCRLLVKRSHLFAASVMAVWLFAVLGSLGTATDGMAFRPIHATISDLPHERSYACLTFGARCGPNTFPVIARRVK
jgi:peptidoglycan/LPS O-acetylase OafA/YrhL